MTTIRNQPAGAKSPEGSPGRGGWLPKEVSLAILGAALLTFLYTTVYLAVVDEPEVVSVISAQTERVRFIDPTGQGTITIYGMKSTWTEDCIDGLIVLHPQAMASYGRVGDDRVYIDIEPRHVRQVAGQPPLLATYRPRSGEPRQLVESSSLRWDTSCAQVHAARFPGEASLPPLPVFGSVQLGAEHKPQFEPGLPPARLLLSGKLTVSARSIGRLRPSTIYPVTDVVLPVGARLEAGAGFESGKTRWWGVAYIDPQKPALSVELATSAPSFRLFYPGRPAADVISVSSLSQFKDDPEIVTANFFLVGLAAIIGIVLWFVEKFSRIADDK